MLLRFISDSASPYYKSALFMGILKYVSKNNAKFVLKQNNNRLMLTVREVKGMGQAWEILDRMHAGALAEGDTSGKKRRLKAHFVRKELLQGREAQKRSHA